MLVQLRPIAVLVCVAVAVPLLFATKLPASLRPFALALFFPEVLVGIALFWYLRTRTQATRGIYAAWGLLLGLTPYGLFLLIARLTDHAAPPVLMLVAGALIGILSGFALSRLDPFDRSVAS